MDLEIKVRNIESGEVSKLLREVKQELFAPIAPSPIEQLLQAYLQRQELPQGHVPPQQVMVYQAPSTGLSEVNQPQTSYPTPPQQFSPSQAFGAAGMRQFAPASEPKTEVPATAVSSELASEPNSEPTQPPAKSGKAWKKHLLSSDPFQNNLLFAAVVVAIVFGGYCGFSRQSPLTVLRLQPAEQSTIPTPAPTAPTKPSH
jgi:hypothetical protein